MSHHPDTSLISAPIPGVPGALLTLASSHTEAAENDGAGIVSEIHEYQVPLFAVQALDRLYGSLYGSYRHLQLCEDVHVPPHTWVGYRCGEIVGVLLFRVETSRVLVLTEMFMLDETIATCFCHSVFDRYPSSHAIVFNAISMNMARSALPFRQYVFSENYVLDLPDSVEAYFERLG